MSPTLNGFNTSIITPPAKLESVPEKAIPMASPTAPNMATKLVISTPNLAMADTTTRIFSIKDVTLVMKVVKPASVLLLVMILEIILAIILESQNPPTTMTIAMSRLLPRLNNISFILVYLTPKYSSNHFIVSFFTKLIHLTEFFLCAHIPYFCGMFFLLSKALLFLLSPFTWFMACVLLSFFMRNAFWSKRFKWASLLLFFVFTNSFFLLECTRLWEIHGKKPSEIGTYQVGIVLTGMAEYDNNLDRISIRRGTDRLWQALTLYHQGKVKKILISGDHGYISDRGLHEAKQFKQVLIGWGIPASDIITEDFSRNTHENAVETKKLLEKTIGIRSYFLLITSGRHMRRSLACFQHEGLKCVPFSTDLYTGKHRSYFWDQYFVPNVENFSEWNALLKEVVGYFIYDISGYI